jgi:CDP-4-dehydro-6-deoxyglucose reductase
MDTNQEVALQGPAGMFTLDESKEKNNVMFLATGTGIAPIRSMIHQLLSSEEKCSKLETVNLLWGLKSSTDIYYHEEFLTLSEKYPKFKIKLCLSRETNLNKIDFADKEICSLNRIDIEYKNMLEKNEKLITDCDYYLCSGRQIVESIREELYSLQIPKENVHFERF